MGPPVPKTPKGWALFAATVGLMALLCVLSGFAAGKGCDADAAAKAETLCDMELASAYTDAENLEWLLEAWENDHEGELAECKMDRKEREAFWTEKLEETRAEVAGEWCWNELKDCEYTLEGEKKDCLFSMKAAGHLRYRSSGAITKCDTCIKQNGIKKPYDHPKERPDDWKKSGDWAEGIELFTEAEVDKISE